MNRLNVHNVFLANATKHLVQLETLNDKNKNNLENFGITPHVWFKKLPLHARQPYFDMHIFSNILNVSDF